MASILFIVQQVIQKKLANSQEINLYVFYPCQQAKRHQLSYPIFTIPLEQVFLDV
jgi:hypothetical protein